MSVAYNPYNTSRSLVLQEKEAVDTRTRHGPHLARVKANNNRDGARREQRMLMIISETGLFFEFSKAVRLHKWTEDGR
jgi:hypothetical protein